MKVKPNLNSGNFVSAPESESKVKDGTSNPPQLGESSEAEKSFANDIFETSPNSFELMFDTLHSDRQAGKKH
jgi:hypothetical protein